MTQIVEQGAQLGSKAGHLIVVHARQDQPHQRDQVVAVGTFVGDTELRDELRDGDLAAHEPLHGLAAREHELDQALRRFVEEIVFARPETAAVTADPDKRNTASVRAFEKAGFLVVREFHDPEDDEPHVLVRRDRG